MARNRIASYARQAEDTLLNRHGASTGAAVRRVKGVGLPRKRPPPPRLGFVGSQKSRMRLKSLLTHSPAPCQDHRKENKNPGFFSRLGQKPQGGDVLHG